MSGSSHRSRGRIALFVVIVLSAIVVSCAPKGGVSVIEPFYPDYYIVKDLRAADIRKLEKIASNVENRSSMHAAGLILGKHALENGEIRKARHLLLQHYQEVYLTDEMRLWGKLWLFDAAIILKDADAARQQAVAVGQEYENPQFSRVLRSYCIMSGMSFQGSDVTSCYQERLARLEGDASSVALGSLFDDNLTMDNFTVPSAPGSATVRITGGDLSSEMVKGMMLAIKNYSLPYQIEVGDGDSPTEGSSAVVNVKTGDISFHEYDLDFSSKETERAREVAGYILLEEYDIAVIGGNERTMPLVKAMEGELQRAGVDTLVGNYDDQNFQRALKGVQKKLCDNRVIYIGFGSEEDMLTFVPLAKFFSEEDGDSEIVIVLDSLGPKLFEGEYFNYFVNAVVVTDMPLLNDLQAIEVYNDYAGFYGSDPRSEAFIGYDMIVFVRSVLAGGGALRSVPPFISNIGHLGDERVVRQIRFFRIESRDRLAIIAPDVPTPLPQPGMGSTPISLR